GNLPWLDLLKGELAEQFTSFKHMIERGIDIANEADGPYHYEEALRADIGIIDQVLNNINDWDALQEVIKSSKLKALSTKRVECDEAKKDQIKEIRAILRKQLNTLKERWFSRSLRNHLGDMEKLHPVVRELTKLVLQFEARFVAEKRKRTIIDFNDLEHFALRILTDEQSNENQVVPSQIA